MRRVFRIPFSRAHIAREVDDELAFHIEMRTQRLVERGWSPDAARREAFRQFGNVNSVREDCVVMDQQREQATRRANMVARRNPARIPMTVPRTVTLFMIGKPRPAQR